jgi:mono/diheme cytochrome c family protein
MTSIFRRGPLLVVWLLSVAAPLRAADADKPPSPEAVAFFETKVRPVLADHCFKCHGEAKQRGGLRLDSRADLLAGGDKGKVVIPGNVEESRLLQAVNRDDDIKPMPPPPADKLSPQQVADLTQWVKMGAPWPGSDKAAPKSSGVRRGPFTITPQDRAHWAFQPVKRPAVPDVKDKAWVANPIDAFILSKLEAKGLKPNPPAAKRELIRRVTYDLTGLPPTPEEVEAFANDLSSDAYEKLVDRLLDSPRYGEQWGRHWLDLVRFAETNSYERDGPKPHAWRYRDYVIRAFNADKPYDRFVKEQLAGDELSDVDGDALIATGYYRLGIWDDEPSDPLQARYDGLDDIVATTGQVFLGLTVDCARCHDHKLDPIAQKDYYRLLSFFHNITSYRNGGPTDEGPIFTNAEEKKAYQSRFAAWKKRHDQVRAVVATGEADLKAAAEQELRDAGKDVPKNLEVGPLTAEEGNRLLGEERFEELGRLRKELLSLQRPPAPTGGLALCVSEPGREVPETFVLQRGNAHAPGDKVEPAFPQTLGDAEPVIPEPPADAKTSGRRLALAEWIASKDNPVAARVMVNRVWQYHFGRGIVRSPNNFGLQGDKPTHPELLDWLAAEFVERGWRLKPMHRLILLSNAYRMSSRGDPDALKADPVNDLFWRFDMRRLTAEEVRDTILSASGSLNLKMSGPGVYPEIPKEVLAGQSMPGAGWGKSPPEEQNRRSIYVHVKRSLLLPVLENFDAAETDRPSPVRFATTQPTQALALLNSAFLNQQASAFAARVHKEVGDDVDKQVRRALSLATTRQPTEEEVRRGVRLIEEFKSKDTLSNEAAVKYFCLMVLNLNETVYLD